MVQVVYSVLWFSCKKRIVVYGHWYFIRFNEKLIVLYGTLCLGRVVAIRVECVLRATRKFSQ